MNRFYFFVLFILSLSLNLIFAAEDNRQGLDERDIEALRDWINTKRQVTVKERGGNLSISGEVRAELKSTNEKKGGIKQLGSGGAVRHKASRAWDVEANLLMDYRTDRTWAAIKIKFDNNAGVETGKSDKLSLNRAVLGGRILDGDTYNMNLEIGRRALGYSFDSKIQFGSMMDGILYQYDQAFDEIGDLYFHGGPFVINDTLDQYGYVGEFGLLNIGRTGFYSKLSAIDWATKHTYKSRRNKAFRFLNLQWLCGYKFTPQPVDKVVTLYGAGLVNTLARGTTVTGGSKERWAWYAGFSVGELRKQWDWAFDLNYQWVQTQAIPDFDGSGVGRGNAQGIGLYSEKKMGKEGKLDKKSEVAGAGNYRGVAIEFIYLLTNNITVYQAWRQSVPQNRNIGEKFSYKQYEIELIYAF